jgi:tetratricopeptide (TPR) repeat protein
MKRVLLAGAVLAAAICLPAREASAQTGTARGKVVDDKGQGVPEAAILMEYQGPMTRKFETKTNKKGEFTQVGMAPGTYRVTATKDGYQGTFIETRIALGEPTYLPDMKMLPKAVAQAAAAASDKGMQELKGGFEKANALMESGQLDQAEAEFRALIAKNPDIPQLQHNLAVVLTRKKDMAGAEATYLKLLETRPDYTDAYAGLTNLYLSSGQPDKAVEALTKAAAARPEDGKIQYQLGYALFNASQYEPAEAAFKKAATLDAANAEIHYYLGTIALTSGRNADCVQELEKYLSMNPTNTQNKAVAPGLMQACKAAIK